MLGIDYGTKRVGVALSDERGEIAFPRVVLVNMPRLVREIAAMVRSEGVRRVVVGESRRADGGNNVLQRDIERFRQELAGALPDVPIVFQHEGMSTISAGSIVRAHRGVLSRPRHSPVERARARQPKDARAAAIILQRHLDTRSIAVRGTSRLP